MTTTTCIPHRGQPLPTTSAWQPHNRPLWHLFMVISGPYARFPWHAAIVSMLSMESGTQRPLLQNPPRHASLDTSPYWMRADQLDKAAPHSHHLPFDDHYPPSLVCAFTLQIQCLVTIHHCRALYCGAHFNACIPTAHIMGMLP